MKPKLILILPDKIGVANADVEHRLPTGMTWLPQDTFALQGHPPMPGRGSKACFRSIRVKILPN